MTRLEWCNENIALGAQLGLVSGAKLDFYVRYSVYLIHRKNGKKHPEAIRLSADECSCDATCIYKAIYFFAENSKES